MQDTMIATLRIYKWPSQAMWRYLEVEALRGIEYDRPILEIGCGSGQLTAMIFDTVDEAIDINVRAVDRSRRICGRNGPLYRRVRCLDARLLHFENDGYGTVFANCVLEHIPDVQRILQGCFRSLRPGGKLVITVPLLTMNKHLLFRWKWYCRVRQHQLQHVNLFHAKEWESILRQAGFVDVEFRPYLSARLCRFWDTLDSPGCLGLGRYHASAALALLACSILSKRLKELLLHRLAAKLLARVNADPPGQSPCAVVITARKERRPA